ncbi:hypothetical protein SAMN05518683_11772, partial [Salibacterium halotolerans]
LHYTERGDFFVYEIEKGAVKGHFFTTF